MDIKCKKTICVFNDSFNCSAGEITVGNDLDCKTYQKDQNLTTKEERDLNKTMFEIAPEIAPYKPSKSYRIDCKVTGCLFNRQGNCSANGISVLSGRKSPFCATHIEK